MFLCSAPAAYVTQKLDLIEDYVTIVNPSTEDVSMAGFQVKSKVSTQAYKCEDDNNQ
jgi:hypothetical protein